MRILLFPWPACSSTPLALALSLKSSLNYLCFHSTLSFCHFPRGCRDEFVLLYITTFCTWNKRSPSCCSPLSAPKPQLLSVCVHHWTLPVPSSDPSPRSEHCGRGRGGEVRGMTRAKPHCYFIRTASCSLTSP